MISDSVIYTASILNEPLRQGEIISNLTEIKLELSSLDTSKIRIEQVSHPFAIIVSQDCDLDWDFHARQTGEANHKLLPRILLCEVTTAENLKGGSGINSSLWAEIRKNKNERYHFFEQIPNNKDAIGEGLPELGADFKRYFTISTSEIYKRLELNNIKRRCRLVSPYLEHFSTRFCYYQYRIALPADHHSEPVS